MRDPQCETEHFNDRVIFMSMYNDIVNTIQRQLRIVLADSLVFLGAWTRRKVVLNLL